MRLIPSSRTSTYDDETTFPCKGLSAIAADITLPSAVGDFAQGGEYGGPLLTVHAQDRGKILDDQDAAFADFSEQSAGRVFVAALPWRGR